MYCAFCGKDAHDLEDVREGLKACRDCVIKMAREFIKDGKIRFVNKELVDKLTAVVDKLIAEDEKK